MERKSCRPAATREQVLTAQQMRCATCGQTMWVAYHTPAEVYWEEKEIV